MNTRDSLIAVLLFTAIVGCQSTSWPTALKSPLSKMNKGGRDRDSRITDRDAADDVNLISKENRNRSSRDRSRETTAGDRVAGGRAGGEDVNAVLRSGHQAEADGQLKQAKMYYHQALDLDPRNALAHHRLAILADKEGDFTKAEEHYLTALSVNRNDPNLLSDLGYSFLLQNRIRDSRYYLDLALKSDPKHLRALNNLGLLQARQGDYDGALAMFRQTGSDRDAQMKMAELFPNGRPAGNDQFPADDTALARNASHSQLPQVVPAPWEGGAMDGRVQNVSGSFDPRGGQLPPTNQSGGGTAPAFPDETNRPSADQFSRLGPGDTRNPAPSAGLPGEGMPTSRQLNANPQQQAFPPLDSRDMPADPLDAMKEWPPRDSQTNPQGGQSVPFPAETGQHANPFPSYGGNVPTATASAANDQPFPVTAPRINGGLGQNAAPPIDPRKQAALMGMNAGPGGVFPVSYESETTANGARQPVNSTPTRPAPVDPLPKAGPLTQTAPAAGWQQQPPGYDRSYQPEYGNSQPPAMPFDAVGSQTRTAARPVIQSQGREYAPAGRTESQQSFPAQGRQPMIQQPSNQLPPPQYQQQQQTYPQRDNGTQIAPRSYNANSTQPMDTFNPGNTYQPQPQSQNRGW